MKKSRKISVFVTLAVSLIFLGCSNPSSQGNGSGSNNGGGSTPTSPDNPGNTPTNPDNPSGGGDTPGVNTDPETPKYEWLQTKFESYQENHSTNFDLEYRSSSNYSYTYYNSSSDYSNISLTTTNTNQTLNETVTNSETESKTVLTYSLSNNTRIHNSTTYEKENGSWIKLRDLIIETDQESGFNWKQISRTFNNNTIESETIYEYSIELLSTDGEIKRYKQIQTNQTPTIYSIREIKNGECLKQQTYNMNDVLQSEMIYHKSNNAIVNERLPDYYLFSVKSYSDGTLVLEYDQEITIITVDDNKLVFEMTPTTNTSNSFQKSKYTYEKKQVPLLNSQQ